MRYISQRNWGMVIPYTMCLRLPTPNFKLSDLHVAILRAICGHSTFVLPNLSWIMPCGLTLFRFNSATFGRNPWKGDRPIGGPLSTQGKTRQHIKPRIQSVPWARWEPTILKRFEAVRTLQAFTLNGHLYTHLPLTNANMSTEWTKLDQ
jgi:hypothetical protein